MSEKQYGMVINTTRCFGCQTCVVICKVNNLVGGDAYWSRLESLDGEVPYQATGTFPNVRMSFRPVQCNHCTDPACVAACPTGAMAKDPETGGRGRCRRVHRLPVLPGRVPLRRACARR